MTHKIIEQSITNSPLLYRYNNGNALIEIYDDGTRTTEWPDGEELKLDYPLNIDIRLMTKCAFGYNPTTGKSVCSFCHESARTDGQECDYDELLNMLQSSGLPKGVELAIGMNEITDGLEKFLENCYQNGWIVNGTINQGTLAKRGTQERLKTLIDKKHLKGVGISFRPKMPKMPQWLLDYSNTVVHVITGIDNFKDVFDLHQQGVKKILVLGEKDFGFNQGKVNLTSDSHQQWKKDIMLLTRVFDVVSFDNLALVQLSVKDKIPHDMWEEFYQGEHSFYINAVEQVFAPSSRSALHIKKWNDISLKDYFHFLEEQAELKLNLRENGME